MTSEEPRRIGKYQVVQALSDEPLAEAFQAHLDGIAGFRRAYAVKLFRPGIAADAPPSTLLERRAREAAAVLHSNIVQLLDFGREGDRPYAVCEWVDGWSLHDVLAHLQDTSARVPVREASWIAVQLLQGLEYAHTRHADEPVVHGAIRPAQVILSRGGQVKLADMGLAVTADELATRPELELTPLPPIAPEVVDGHEPTPAADLHAVGVLLRHMLTGEHAGDDAGPLADAMPELPKELTHVVDMALAAAPKPSGDATTFKDALQDVLHDLGGVPTPEHLSHWLHELFGENPERANHANQVVSQDLDEDDLLAEPDDEPELELHDIPDTPDNTAESARQADEDDLGPSTMVEEEDDDGRTAVSAGHAVEGHGCVDGGRVGVVDAAVATKLAVLKARGTADTVDALNEEAIQELVQAQARKSRVPTLLITLASLVIGFALGAMAVSLGMPAPGPAPAAFLTIEAPSAATIRVDGAAHQAHRPLTPGQHTILVQVPDAAPWDLALELVDGEHRVLRVDAPIQPSPNPEPAPSDATP